MKGSELRECILLKAVCRCVVPILTLSTFSLYVVVNGNMLGIII